MSGNVRGVLTPTFSTDLDKKITKIDYRKCFMCGKQYDKKKMINVVDDIWYCDKDYRYVTLVANQGEV